MLLAAFGDAVDPSWLGEAGLEFALFDFGGELSVLGLRHWHSQNGGGQQNDEHSERRHRSGSYRGGLACACTLAQVRPRADTGRHALALDPSTLQALLDQIERFVAERLRPIEAEVADNDEVPAEIIAQMRAFSTEFEQTFGITRD